tara:strand:- start:1776 stop:2288 length:513 start_codon:yes stop_codon:yes gene_type:complete
MKIKSLHLIVNIPKSYDYFEFDSNELDKLLLDDINSSNEALNYFRKVQISTLYQQKTGKLHLFYDQKANILFFSQATTGKITQPSIDANLKYLKQDLERINTSVGTNFKIVDTKAGRFGEKTYFVVEIRDGEYYSYTAYVNQGYRSWEMFYQGNEPLDYKAIIASFRLLL